MNQLVVFDLGETLVSYQGVPLNWSSNYIAAICSALEQLGIDPDDEQLSLATSILNFYNTRISPRLFEVCEGEVLQKVANVFGTNRVDFELLFFGYFQRKAMFEPGAEATLAALKNHEVKLSVLSDVPYGMPKRLLLDDLGSLAPYLDDVCSSCEVGFRKPHPQGLLAQIDKHGASQSSTVFVGNEAKDIECAAKAGVKSVLIDPSGAKNFGQSHTVNTIAEVLSIVL